MALAYTQAIPNKGRPEPVPEAGSIVAQIGTRPIVFVRAPFNGFKPESESLVVTPRHEHDPRLRRIAEAWGGFAMTCHALEKEDECKDIEKIYPMALDAVSGIHCSANDLRTFMTALPDLQDGSVWDKSYAGIFISALINCGPDQRYVVRTDHLEDRGLGMGLLGTFNQKDVIVEGNAGFGTGCRMRRGSITIEGNTWFFTGEKMKGGLLTVNGNTDSQTGCEM